jgi:fatty-acyl-CoA synthase
LNIRGYKVRIDTQEAPSLGLVTVNPAGALAKSVNKAWLRALETTGRLTSVPGRTLPMLVDDLGLRFGNTPALLSDRETFTYTELAARARQYSRWAITQGLGRGDTVALMMPNRPEYLAIWLGVSRTGAVVALLNIHLTGPSLGHCVNIAGPKHIIVAAELEDRFSQAQGHLQSAAQIWIHGVTASDRERVDLAIERLSTGPLTAAEEGSVNFSDRALLIYTSGTTGLPKAANVSHRRVLMWSGWFAGLMASTPEDRLYNCLPMYHSVGGVVAIGGVLVHGGSVVLKEKFSAREFWADIRRWDCTLFQYIGELCRYLLNAPPHPDEARHRLRLACGNGLRSDVWAPFQQRFGIPQLLEFYAATEGNVSLYNVEGEPGAIGRIPPFLSHRFAVAIVKFDPDTGAPLRGKDGFCILCLRGEPGEAIGRIASPKGETARFEGYTGADETEKKVLRNVFEPGDAWFRTGDLMRQDARGFFYFIDRVGDTFRWKGENVSTGEVAEALLSCAGVVEANVYGVQVPAADGRAGMAALVVDDRFDLSVLRAHLRERLPAYARPVFIRITAELAATETFKQKKRDLAAEGFDPLRVADALYVDDGATGRYAVLDGTMFALISAGRMRL